MKILLWYCALSIFGVVNSSPSGMMKESASFSRMRMADLETSETGYAYGDAHPGNQRTYVYTNHGNGGYYETPKTVNRYVVNYGPGEPAGPEVTSGLPIFRNFALPGQYVAPLLPLKAANPHPPPIAPYYQVTLNSQPQGHSHEEIDEDDRHDDESEEKSEEERSEDFNNREHSSQGENGDEGYQSRHKFESGEQEVHSKDRHEGDYVKKGGTEKSSSESGGHYNDYDESEEGNDGESHGEKSYHDRGVKTTGYHKVYHKDEYKKDTDFYDHEDKGGHYDKYSSSNGHHSSAEGEYKKGKKHDSAHENHEKGKKGQYDKGRESSLQNSFKSQNGQDSYYENHSDHSENEGTKENKKYAL